MRIIGIQLTLILVKSGSCQGYTP